MGTSSAGRTARGVPQLAGRLPGILGVILNRHMTRVPRVSDRQAIQVLILDVAVATRRVGPGGAVGRDPCRRTDIAVRGIARYPDTGGRRLHVFRTHYRLRLLECSVGGGTA